jgi:hypothetical protein
MIQFSRLNWKREERIELLCQIALSTLPMVEESLIARVVGYHINSVAAINRQLEVELCASCVIASIAAEKQSR